jgi:hypothetical protein
LAIPKGIHNHRLEDAESNPRTKNRAGGKPMTKIILQYPGGELTLFKYKRKVPDHLFTQKMAEIASTYFSEWDWAPDGDIPAIWCLTDDRKAILGVRAKPKECFL